MLCKCAANLRDGNCWEVLMSSFVLGRIQDCDDLRGPKLCMIKDLQAVFHKLNRSVNVRLTPSQQNTVATQPMNLQQQIVLPRLKRKAWRTRSRNRKRWASLGGLVWCHLCVAGYNWLLLALMIPDVCSRLFVGRVNQHFENLTQDCARQTSMFFLLAPPGEKQDTFGFPEMFNFDLSSLDPQFTFQVGCVPSRGIGCSRFGTGLLVENWAVEHLVMAIWCLQRFLTTCFNHQI